MGSSDSTKQDDLIGVGDRIDDIKITDTLGAGAFGEVYKGIWQSDTTVALKKITGGQIEEFKKEAKIL